VYNQVSDAFKGDIEDTSAHSDNDNTSSNGNAFHSDIEDTLAHDDNADSSNDSYIVYDPSGISNDSIFSSTTLTAAVTMNTSCTTPAALAPAAPSTAQHRTAAMRLPTTAAPL